MTPVKKRLASLVGLVLLGLTAVGCDIPLSESGQYFACDDGECREDYECRLVEGDKACVPINSDVGEPLDAGDMDTSSDTAQDVEEDTAVDSATDTGQDTAADTSEDTTQDTSDTSEDTHTGDADDTNDVDGGMPTRHPMDLLMVLNNEGGMCEENNALAENLSTMVEKWDLDDADIQVGVTTTHKDPDPLDNKTYVAQYGELQSTPVPVPFRFGDCGTDVDKIRAAVERAVNCTANPSQHQNLLSDWDDDTKECIENGEFGTCNIAGFELADIFPPSDAYRDIPTIMSTKDPEYRTNSGQLDVYAFVSDLQCASLVGTVSSSFEKGLGAVVEATSPAKVEAGGANEDFIRADSDFGVLFVSSQNDCTHDGSIDEANRGRCGDDVCIYENSTGVSTSALLSIPDLKTDLIANLRTAKGDNSFDDSRIFAAGLYGKADRYTGPSYTSTECEGDPLGTTPDPVCEPSTWGRVQSGDRYQRFIDLFPTRYPVGSDEARGKLCEPTGFSTWMLEIGEGIENFTVR